MHSTKKTKKKRYEEEMKDYKPSSSESEDSSEGNKKKKKTKSKEKSEERPQRPKTSDKRVHVFPKGSTRIHQAKISRIENSPFNGQKNGRNLEIHGRTKEKTLR